MKSKNALRHLSVFLVQRCFGGRRER